MIPAEAMVLGLAVVLGLVVRAAAEGDLSFAASVLLSALAMLAAVAVIRKRRLQALLRAA